MGTKLLVRRDEPEKTKGGILLPESAQRKPHTGVVLAAGSGYPLSDGTRRPLAVTVGDRVMFAKSNGGAEVEIGGESLLVLDEREVFGVFGEE